MVSYGVFWYGALWYGTVWYGTVGYCMAPPEVGSTGVGGAPAVLWALFPAGAGAPWGGGSGGPWMEGQRTRCIPRYPDFSNTKEGLGD